MENKIIYTFMGLFAIAFISLMLMGILGSSASCTDKKDFIESAYNAIIIKKFLDKENHSYETLLYSRNNKLSVMTLIDDTSGYYKFVKAGDSIYKNKNSEYINVNHVKQFRIYFDCK